MFAKVCNRDKSTFYVMDVTELRVLDTGQFFVESLRQDGYAHIPTQDGFEVKGRKLIATSAGEEERLIFCNDVVYLCNEKGQTVDRIACRERDAI